MTVTNKGVTVTIDRESVTKQTLERHFFLQHDVHKKTHASWLGAITLVSEGCVGLVDSPSLSSVTFIVTPTKRRKRE